MEWAILDMVIAEPRISQKEIAHNLKLTVDGIRYHMDKLKSRGFLERIGGKKTGYWKVKIDEKTPLEGDEKNE